MITIYKYIIISFGTLKPKTFKLRKLKLLALTARHFSPLKIYIFRESYLFCYKNLWNIRTCLYFDDELIVTSIIVVPVNDDSPIPAAALGLISCTRCQTFRRGSLATCLQIVPTETLCSDLYDNLYTLTNACFAKYWKWY